MATILRTYDWSYVSKNNKKARSRSYPWDEWFDGRIRELHPGEDFDGPATSLERVIRTTANRRGVKVRIRIDEKNIVLQRHDEAVPARTVTKSPSLQSIKARRAQNEAEHALDEGNKVAKRVAKRASKPSTNGDEAPAPRRRKLVKAAS